MTPTKEQVQEVRNLLAHWGGNRGVIDHSEIAEMLAAIRQQAQAEAYEKAIIVGREFVGLAHQVSEFEAGIRALAKPTAEPQQ